MTVERDESDAITRAPEATTEPTSGAASEVEAPAGHIEIADAAHAPAAAEASAQVSDGAPAAADEPPPAPREEVVAPSPPPVAIPSPNEGAPTAAEAPVPSGPYRTPPYEAPRPSPYGRRVMRPLLGPSLGTFGVLLWAYVVAGQLTTSWLTGRPLGNGVALAAVVLATFVAWALGMRRSLAVAPASPAGVVGRAVGVLALCLAMYLVTLVFAVFVGTTAAPGHDFGIAFALVTVAFVAVVLGRRLVTPEVHERTHGERVVTVAVWVTCLLLTFVAGVDLAANG